MEWTLEVVIVPVSDVDRSKKFYEEGMGFVVDHDTTLAPGQRIVQLTPRGSGCSVVISTGMGVGSMKPGDLSGLQLVVRDLRAAREELVSRGVEVGEIELLGPGGGRPATDQDDLNNAGFMSFADPDGNAWAVQQITARS